MTYTINTRSLGPITFSRPGGAAIFCDMGEPNKARFTGYQLARGGHLVIYPLDYNALRAPLTLHGECQPAFEQICKSWWAQYRRKYI